MGHLLLTPDPPMRIALAAVCASLLGLPALPALAEPLAGALTGAPVLEHRQSGRNVLSFTLGAGGSVAPGYFGSDTYEVGPAGRLNDIYLRWGRVELGNPDPDAIEMGFGVRGSFRYIAERSADDYSELRGMTTIDPALELGAGIAYTQPSYEVFADVRYGIGGHESAVGEIGMDLISRPMDNLTLSGGPRLFLGSDDYAQTYFGVTAAEAATSFFGSYEAEGGLLGTGVELRADYDLGGPWGLTGAVRYDRLTGDAADSPITALGSEDQVSASIVATRRFSLEF